MSDALRIALVAEGPTDGIVIESALRAIVHDRGFVMTQLQPEVSLAFDGTGGGWRGVYLWCKQSARRGGGRLAMDQLALSSFDVLIIHVDADVARGAYPHAGIVPNAGDRHLPCEQPCPPATNTTNDLRAVVLSWCGENIVPPKVVLCTPSKNTEAWVVRALFPGDVAVTGGAPFECFPDPESRLGQQSKHKRIRKSQRDYRERADALRLAWSSIALPPILGEAHRFQSEILGVLFPNGVPN